jgi:hypothetical protein
MGCDFGWFCPRCSTVVINPTDVSAHLTHSLPGWDIGTEFAMLGLVHLGAIPPDIQHRPLGADDNPTPPDRIYARVQSADRWAIRALESTPSFAPPWFHTATIDGETVSQTLASTLPLVTASLSLLLPNRQDRD